MVTLTLSEKQVLALVRQLSPERRLWLLEHLLRDEWPDWFDLAEYAAARARAVATARGLDWDRMDENERESFIDAILHEPDPV
ncbi:MAG: hypothetical protein D6790_07360 [Caldilineae bacterium]|nr:MAG: hypothetical protein D6790_07360 [Caldilineae bacterium]